MWIRCDGDYSGATRNPAASKGAYGEERNGRGDPGAAPQAVKPRQSHVSRGWFHQGAHHRLLRPHRAGAAASPPWTSAYLETLSERRERNALLREELPRAPARIRAGRAYLASREQPMGELLPGAGFAYLNLGREFGRHRAAHIAIEIRRHDAADLHRLRPRSRRASQHRAMLPGRAVGAGSLRPFRSQ